MEFNIQRLFSENHLRAYFTKYVGWLGGMDFDQGVFDYCVTETKSRFINRKQKELQFTLLHVTPCWNHLLYYVHLDDRAKDLRTTTSPTQALSDEYDKNSGFITAVKITALFRLKLKSPLNT